MNAIAYFDYTAMTPVDPEVQAVLQEGFALLGNAGASHELGLASKCKIEAARAQVAASIGADAREIVFTSGATESDNLALKGVLNYQGRGGGRLITVQSEHKAVLDSAAALSLQGVEVVVLSIDERGLIDEAQLAQELARKPTTLVSVMAVNNETGVCQNLPEIARLAHAHGAKFHVDAAQAPGKIPVDVAAWDADLVSFSGQKIYGPQGIGALFVRRLPKVRLAPQMTGGGQERGLRSGTLPIALILGFAKALALAVTHFEQRRARVVTLAQRILAALPEGLGRNGALAVPHILNLYTGHNVQEVLARAQFEKLALSAGSACSSDGSGSHVLRAMGLGVKAQQSLRVSLSHCTTDEECARLIAFLAQWKNS